MLYAREIGTENWYQVEDQPYRREVILISPSGERKLVFFRDYQKNYTVISDLPRLFRLGRTGAKTHYGSGMCGGTRINQGQYVTPEFGVATCKKCLEHQEHFERRARENFEAVDQLFKKGGEDNG